MTDLTVPDTPKMLRETFCVAQARIGASGDPRAREHIDRLQRLIDECDRHRPLGPDGQHGDRHTWTCGCEDVQVLVPPLARADGRRLCRVCGWPLHLSNRGCPADAHPEPAEAPTTTEAGG